MIKTSEDGTRQSLKRAILYTTRETIIVEIGKKKMKEKIVGNDATRCSTNGSFCAANRPAVFFFRGTLNKSRSSARRICRATPGCTCSSATCRARHSRINRECTFYLCIESVLHSFGYLSKPIRK